MRTSVARRVVQVLAVVALMAGLVSALPMPVQTNSGPVYGVVEGNVTSFKGIPYATPPLGSLRWTAPKPPAPWSTPLNATRYSKICSQPTWDFLPPQLAAMQSEDCLYLNVWTPSWATPSSKLPVMVWFHPGGNFKGSAVGFAGTVLAPYGDIVVVTLNYRLGIMGFLVIEGALLESPEVNYGLLDQQLALRWVSENIAAFGGDPNHVTIAGESAGGGDVLLQMLMPGAFSFYGAAIAESPATPIASTIADALKTTDIVAAKVGCTIGTVAEILACLRAAPVRRLVNDPLLTAGATIDHVQLMDQPLRLFRDGRFNKRVPLLSGMCQEEGNLLMLLGEGPPPMSKQRYYELIEQNWAGVGAVEFVTKMYAQEAATRGYWHASSLAEGDGWINCFSTDATNNTANYGSTTYHYLWTHIPEIPSWIPQSMNATHSVELPFVFGLHEEFTPAEAVLSRQTMSYWISFITCANPNGCPSFSGEPRPFWPVYNPNQPNTMLVLDLNITLTSSFRSMQCEQWNLNVWYK